MNPTKLTDYRHCGYTNIGGSNSTKLVAVTVPNFLLTSDLITFLSYFVKNNKMLINVNKKVQLDATVCRYLFTAKSLYMFRASQHPSSGALETLTATSGIGHTVKFKLKIKN